MFPISSEGICIHIDNRDYTMWVISYTISTQYCIAKIFPCLKYFSGSSHRGSVLTNLTSIHEDEGSNPASLSGLRIWRCRELRRRLQMRLGSPTFLRLWCRPASVAHPLAWELPCFRCCPGLCFVPWKCTELVI